MRTQAETIEWVKALDPYARCLDGRDMLRLSEFFPESDWHHFGVKRAESAAPPDGTWMPKPWTEEAVLAQLRADLAFGFQKALDKRGISASLMHTVVRQWLWVLDHPLRAATAGDLLYAEYGLPSFKAVALAFGFDNPIGDDSGSERKYSADGDASEEAVR